MTNLSDNILHRNRCYQNGFTAGCKTLTKLTQKCYQWKEIQNDMNKQKLCKTFLILTFANMYKNIHFWVNFLMTSQWLPNTIIGFLMIWLCDQLTLNLLRFKLHVINVTRGLHALTLTLVPQPLDLPVRGSYFCILSSLF